MNWIYKNHELKTSGCYNMNFLFNNGKFYIMDNHLAAAWCWLQKIDTSKRYGLFHIDRHYDLLNNLTDDFIAENRSELINKDFFFYLSLKDNMNNQAIIILMLLTNYTPIFYSKFIMQHIKMERIKMAQVLSI